MSEFLTARNLKMRRVTRILTYNLLQGRNLLKGIMEKQDNSNETTICEGLATIKTSGKVFYNPVQEFNRDLSISVLTLFAKKYARYKSGNAKNRKDIENTTATCYEAGSKYEEGLSLLEALSATGLRSIRYAKEVPGINNIVANDISAKAVEDIKNNICQNKVDHLVTASHNDATLLMYQHRKENTFDAIDLDPYGCPSIFLDSAVQSIKDGGLLLVTATDMAVLAGNSPETCYSKYGSIALRIKCCHEMALRILLQCIESHANRYGKYIVPLLSISADFYIRVFVRIFSSPSKCKHTLSKLSSVFHCTGCDSFVLQPLGFSKINNKSGQVKFGLPTGPAVSNKCEHCQHPYHMGGPIWSAPIHSSEFVEELLENVPESLGTFERIKGVLSVIKEELPDCPLYYTLERLSSTLHLETPSMLSIRSALLNAGYKVSFSHAHRTSIKTDAPSNVVWDIMRCWATSHPVSKKRLIENTPVANILAKEPEKVYSFENHPEANPESRKHGYLRFQENPLPNWGPGTRATAMIGDQKIVKSKRNQGKRKRDKSEESAASEDLEAKTKKIVM